MKSKVFKDPVHGYISVGEDIKFTLPKKCLHYQIMCYNKRVGDHRKRGEPAVKAKTKYAHSAKPSRVGYFYLKVKIKLSNAIRTNHDDNNIITTLNMFFFMVITA